MAARRPTPFVCTTDAARSSRRPTGGRPGDRSCLRVLRRDFRRPDFVMAHLHFVGCCNDRLNPPSFDDIEYATLEWVAWFNTTRLPEPLGYLPPAEFEAPYHAAVSASAEAVLKWPSLRKSRGGSAMTTLSDGQRSVANPTVADAFNSTACDPSAHQAASCCRAETGAASGDDFSIIAPTLPCLTLRGTTDLLPAAAS